MKFKRSVKYILLSLFAIAVFAACKPTTYTVTFDAANGSALTTQSVVKGKMATKPSLDPAKEEHTFEYWYAGDVNVAYVFTTPITANLTLTAKYSAIIPTQTVAVTFDPKNGSATWQVSVNVGASVMAPSTNPIKANEGITNFTFAYWYSDDANTAYVFSTSVTQALTLFAKYNGVDQINATTILEKSSWTVYLDNIKQEDKDELLVYTGANKNYVVGVDNAFQLPLEAIYIDANAVDYTLTKYNRILKLHVKDSANNWQLVTDNALYIEEDAYISGNIDFKETAIGKVFKIIVTLSNDLDESVAFENIQVAAGYNLYTEADLLSASEFATGGSGYGGTVVSTRKTIQATAFYLHNNIVISTANLPAELLETNPSLEAGGSLEGTYLIDGAVLFAFVGEGGSFRLNGNFFAIDGSNVPFVVRDGGANYATPDTTFGVNAALMTVKQYQEATIENINIIGNSQYSDDVQKKGGYITMYLAGNQVSNLENVHMRFAQTALIPTSMDFENYNHVNINHSVISDMFSLGIYNDSCHLDIKNSILSKFGGMAIGMADYANNHDRSSGSRPNPIPMTLTIDANSKIEANIVGEEAWFTVNNLKLVAMQLKGAINSFVSGFGKTVNNPATLEDDINFIAIVTVEAPTDPAWAGCNAYANVKIGDSTTFYQNPTSDPEYGVLSPVIYESFYQAVPGGGGAMLKTSAGGLIYDYAGFNQGFDNFMMKTPEQVMPYIASLPTAAQTALFNQLVIFDVEVAQAAATLQQDPTNESAWALLATMPAKVGNTYQNTIKPKADGNGYLFIKTKIGGSWIGILTELFDLSLPE